MKFVFRLAEVKPVKYHLFLPLPDVAERNAGKPPKK